MGLFDKVKDSINFMKDLPKTYQGIYDTYVKGEIYGSSRGGASIEKVLKELKESGASEEELAEVRADYEKEIQKLKSIKEPGDSKANNPGGKKPKKKAGGGMMNKPRKMSNGGMANKGTKVRGQGAAIRGTKFKGIF
jgi:hypothetical protein